ncbi:MAG TPA: hypothetical protein VMX17_05920 [Candidatus Glassbacteria bacterium]|nr:hypothetical protein [Candidatus Glassbacteria bacterium]
MYLNKKSYVKNWNHQTPEEKHKVIVKKAGKVRKDIKPERISYITEQVGYWRKFNALHGWFVENCQGGKDECQESYVSTEKLKELLESLKAVIKNKDSADEVLPSRGGFFFGGTDYDEYYFKEVKETIKLLEGLLKESEEVECDFYYQASW